MPSTAIIPASTRGTEPNWSFIDTLTAPFRAIFWKSRALWHARAYAHMEARCRAAEGREEATVHELALLAIWVEDQEWVRASEHGFMAKQCPECQTVWLHSGVTRPPKHDDHCGTGRAANAARKAVDTLICR